MDFAEFLGMVRQSLYAKTGFSRIDFSTFMSNFAAIT